MTSSTRTLFFFTDSPKKFPDIQWINKLFCCYYLYNKILLVLLFIELSSRWFVGLVFFFWCCWLMVVVSLVSFSYLLVLPKRSQTTIDRLWFYSVLSLIEHRHWIDLAQWIIMATARRQRQMKKEKKRKNCAPCLQLISVLGPIRKKKRRRMYRPNAKESGFVGLDSSIPSPIGRQPAIQINKWALFDRLRQFTFRQDRRSIRKSEAYWCVWRIWIMNAAWVWFWLQTAFFFSLLNNKQIVV